MFNKEDKALKTEERILTKVLMASIKEQRRARWMRLIMFLLFIFYVPFVLFVLPKLAAGPNNNASAMYEEHVGVVDLSGVIASDAFANANTLITGLRDALENKHSKAVIIRVNSPGGSPVQSDMVYKEILRQRKLNPDKEIYAVIEDIGASGAYYISAAASKIYASESSIVGSIGVTSGGSFGFVDAIKKLGVERRVYTSGKNKAFLDPFLPEKAKDKERYQAMLKNVHKQFIAAVENQRKTRFKEGVDLYNGFMWTGEESKELGLVDDIGSVASVARDVVGVETLVDYTPQPDFFSRFASQIGTAAGDTVIKALMPEPSFK